MAGHIRGFDGIRGLAAGAVVVHHYGYRDTNLGDVAVLVFFALSGFLIVGILHDERRAMEAGVRTWGGAFARFWRNRLLRILPAYLAVLAAAYAAEGALGYVNLFYGLPWYLTFTQNVYVALVQPFWLTMSHTWSIAVEQQFYVLIAPALLLIPRRQHVVLLVALLVLAVFLLCALSQAGLPAESLRLLPFHGMAYIVAGGITALLLRRGSPGIMGGWTALASAVALAWISQPRWLPAGMALTPDAPLPNAVCATACCLLLASCAARNDAPWLRILETRPLRYLGSVSYGLYVVHVPVAFFLSKQIHAAVGYLGFPGALYAPAFFAGVFLLSLGAAAVLRDVVERPVLSLRKGPSRKPTAHPAFAGEPVRLA